MNAGSEEPHFLRVMAIPQIPLSIYYCPRVKYILSGPGISTMGVQGCVSESMCVGVCMGDMCLYVGLCMSEFY